MHGNSDLVGFENSAMWSLHPEGTLSFALQGKVNIVE